MNKQQIKPMKKYVAYGKGGIINASVWRRERKFPNGKTGHFENVSINRSYLDKGSNEWKSTNSYSMKEIEKLHAVLEQLLKDFNHPFQDAQELASGQSVVADPNAYREEEDETVVGHVHAAPQDSVPVHTKRGDVCVVY